MLYRSEMPYVNYFYGFVVNQLKRYGVVEPIIGKWPNDGVSDEEFGTDVSVMENLTDLYSIYIWTPETHDLILESVT